MNEETAKLLIRGVVAEAGIEVQFNRHLEEFRQHYSGVKAVGEFEQAAYVLALSYFAAEIQNEQ